ncbi:MAG: hypothetical protein QM604_09565 [Microbacterium sp.]
MQPREIPRIPTARRRDLSEYDRRRREHVHRTGVWLSAATGALVSADRWRSLTAMDRHAVRVAETTQRATVPVVVAYAAAGAVWGIDRIGAWPDVVDTIVGRTSGGRSTGQFRRHTVVDADPETIEWGGHRLTTPAQTAADIARASSFRDAVVALDQAMWVRRPGGPLATRAQIEGVLVREPRRWGTRKAWSALDFASAQSDSVRESEGRWLLHVLGFPRPVLQRRFVLPDGRDVYCDYYFEEHDHAAEYDGVGKYLDPSLLRGRTPEQALIAEKDRADALRRMVRALSRWRTPAHRDPRILYDILVADGLGSSRPRPPHGLVLR